ncbi:protein lifeguard 2-like [Silurus meridionalis]|nr:protein lifeguard 2-like [Silurus meridionalis]
MTQGKILEVNKLNEGSSLPQPPPSYEEATAGGSGIYPVDGESCTKFSFDDLNVRRTFIRKTLSLSYMTGMLSSYYNTTSVMMCLGITVLVCFSVSVFSFQTKIDMTSCQGVMLIICTSFFICGILLALIIPLGCVPWMHAVFAVLGAIMFSMFLAIDTQLLMGKKRESISPEDYIYATLNIYLDIVYIFSFILQIFGKNRL